MNGWFAFCLWIMANPLFSQLPDIPYNPYVVFLQEKNRQYDFYHGIKSTTIKTKGFGSGAYYTTIIFRYDTLGHCLEENYYYNDSILFRGFIYLYNDSGKRIEKCQIGADTSKRHFYYTYDTWGNLLLDDYSVTYTDKKLPLRFTEIADTNRFIELRFDEKKRLVEYVYGYAKSHAEKDSVIYDKNGNILEYYTIRYSYAHYYPNGKDSSVVDRTVLSTSIKSYDRQNNMVHHSYQGSTGSSYEYTAVFHDDNRIVSSKKGVTTWEYTTTSEGLILTAREFKEGVLLREQFYSYEFW